MVGWLRAERVRGEIGELNFSAAVIHTCNTKYIDLTTPATFNDFCPLH